MSSKRKTSPSWDQPPKKPRADSKLKLRPVEDQETWWLLLHPEDEETTPYTMEALAVHIQEEHGISVASSTLSEWLSWYSLKCRFDRAMQRAEQSKLELLSDPTKTPEEVERVAQIVFTAEAMERQDLAGFVKLKKARQNDRKLDQSDKQLEQNNRRIQLLENAAAEAKAKLLALTSSAQSRGGLTPETLKQIEEAAGLL